MGEHKHDQEPCTAPATKPNHDNMHSAAAANCSIDRVLNKPKGERAAPFTLDQSSLSFAAAVGHPSVYLAVRVSNTSHTPLRVDATIEAAEGANNFELETSGDFVQAHTDDGIESARDFSVRFSPKAAGRHEAVLVLRSDVGGEQRVRLVGTAFAAVGKLEAGAEPQSPLPEHSPDARAKDEPRAALDGLATLGQRYQDAQAANDMTRDRSEKRMTAAVKDLNRRVTTWLQKEGVDTAKRGRDDESGAGEIVHAFLTKGLEGGLEHFLEFGGTPLAATMFALELGGAISGAADGNYEAHESLDRYTEVTTRALDLGVEAQDTATSALMHRYGGVLSRYASTRSDVHNIAGEQAMEVMADLQHVNAQSGDEAYFYEKARTVVDRFRAASVAWGAATGAMERAAIAAEKAVNKGYSSLLQRYLEFRMERAREEKMPKMRQVMGIPIEKAFPRLGEELDQVVVEGGITFSEPANVQFNSFRFGAYDRMSEEMYSYAGSQVIRDIEFAVEVRLFVAEGGRIVVRKAKGPHGYTVEADADAKVYLAKVGEHRLWEVIAGATLTPKVLRV